MSKVLLCLALAALGHFALADEPMNRPARGPDEALALLKEGNVRFAEGRANHPHCDARQLALAAEEDQTNHAYATVLSCSDSRVPPEIVFDSGVMDIFVVRIAGNICRTDEIGSIEYGLAHVKTPLLVVLGHSKCGAVTAAAELHNGHAHELEPGVSSIVRSIQPAVKRAAEGRPGEQPDKLLDCAIEENVWNSIEQLFRQSKTVRELVLSRKAKVVGAVYDLRTHRIKWLPEEKVQSLLLKAGASGQR
ncbi:MAG TPA: carbonic anhydrase [Oligoflexia bacterium]|nr:carbonic anhydrase [Oligoflexia bacterium]